MKPTLHIQHLVLSLQPGGLENGVVNIVNHLDAEQFTSSVCCLKQAGEFASRIKSPTAAVHQMGWQGGNNLRLPFRLAQLFRETGTDIVHTRNAEAFFYGFLGAKLAGVRTIIHSEHGRTFNDRPIRYRVQKMFSRYTNRIFAVSAQLKRDLTLHIGIPERDIDVLYNGVDLARFAPVEKAELRTRLGLDKNDFIVGSVGRLVEVKNYQLLLHAAKALGKQNVKVLLVGDGPERQALEQLAQSIDFNVQTIFAGHRDDVDAFLGAMDVFVLPSLSEGMSNTLLEAMATGIPVVASNVGGNAEIVRDGIDGMLFESNDVMGLCNILKSLYANSDLRINMANSARARVLGDFSIASMVSRYEVLYSSAFDESAHP